MAHNQAPEKLREPLRDALLRCVDWRFLLPGVEPPWSISLVSGRVAEAVRLVSATESDILMRAGEAAVCDLVVIGRPTHAALRRAHAALQPGGAVYCEWALPRPGGAWRARRALRRAGFDEVHLHWPWPPPQRSSPHFWLPLDSAAAAAHLLALRPVRHRREVLLRRLWRIASLVGAVAPLSAIGRRSPAAAADSAGTDSAPAEEIETLLDALALGRESGVSGIPARRSWLLLTGGSRSINKVVGLPFSARDPIPRLVVKFARVAEAEPALHHEADVLRALELERPDLPGIPRVLAVGRRAGRVALAETAIHGAPLLASLTEATFPKLAADVTRWLIELAGDASPRPPAEWSGRLVAEPLEQFERRFAAVADAGALRQARELLRLLPDLPSICEHRDCSPWNIVLTDGGAPALLDWESAELGGLPALDLVYFLTNAAFVVTGALQSGRTREVYRELLDPATHLGRAAADCLTEYSHRLGLDRDGLARLRLLCWIVHCRSDYRHLEMDAAGAPDDRALRSSVFLGLVHEELRIGQAGV